MELGPFGIYSRGWPNEVYHNPDPKVQELTKEYLAKRRERLGIGEFNRPSVENLNEYLDEPGDLL